MKRKQKWLGAYEDLKGNPEQADIPQQTQKVQT